MGELSDWASESYLFLENERMDEQPSSDDDQVSRPPILDERPPSPPLRNASQSEMAVEVINSLLKNKNLLIECPTLLDRKSTILKQILRFWQWRKGNRSIHLTEATNANLQIEISPNPRKIYVVTRNILEARALGEEILDLEYRELLRGINVVVLDPHNDFHAQENMALDQPNGPTNGRKRSSNDSQTQPTSSKKARLETTSCKNTYTKNQDLVAKADLVICSAEYILSSFRREKYGLKIDKSIVMIDDGCDLENMCKDEGTIDITTEQLNHCCQMLRSITDDRELNDEDGICLTELSSSLEELLQWINAEIDSEPSREEILEEIVTLNAGVDYTSLIRILTHPEILANANLSLDKEDTLEKLQKFVGVLQLVCNGREGFEFEGQLLKKESQKSKKETDIILKLWCADPSIILEPISSAAISVIVGANCVAPYSPFYTEFRGIFTKEQTLAIRHDDKLRDRHLIVYATKGPHGKEFDLKFRNRRKPCVKKEVFSSLPAICKEIPNGVVVLFHSDEYFKQLLSGQSGTDLRAALRASGKEVFCELEMVTDADIENWRNAASKGAVLLALSRGKLLRNPQFSFQHVRGVVHVSIPFGAWSSDDVIQAKRDFLDRKWNDTNSVQNKEWYNREAFRVLNESFNYSIKDKNDWGVSIILDIRMHEKEADFGDMLPGWVRHSRTGDMHYEEFSRLIRKVRDKVQEWTGENL